MENNMMNTKDEKLDDEDYFKNLKKIIDDDKRETWSESDEERMNIIGQNGNDGLHYDK
jgi:hypothetical protein